MSHNRFVVGAYACAVLASSPLAAQEAKPLWSSRPSIDTVLAQFEREARGYSTDRSGSGAVIQILGRPNQFAAATVDSLLDGLEHLAMNSPDQRTRSVAAVALSSAGNRDFPHPIAGTADRLIRIFEGTQDPLLRGTLLGLPLIRQADRDRVAAFLAMLATRPSDSNSQGWGDIPTRAIHNLALLGEPGREMLRSLHAHGSVQSPTARTLLDQLARADFRLPRHRIK